jgi:L-alanine-DL-glutamate epimerase-like enolase superfamily enzyme
MVTKTKTAAMELLDFAAGRTVPVNLHVSSWLQLTALAQLCSTGDWISEGSRAGLLVIPVYRKTHFSRRLVEWAFEGAPRVVHHTILRTSEKRSMRSSARHGRT